MKLVSLYQLNENENISLEEAVKIFHDECKPFQKEIGFNGVFDFEPLYRGINIDPLTTVKYFIKSVRENRIPRNTLRDIHDFTDSWFYKKFGVKFRSNALFVIKNEEIALDHYGLSYIIFPIGEFKYCYSNTIDDLYKITDKKILHDDFNNFKKQNTHIQDHFKLYDTYIKHEQKTGFKNVFKKIKEALDEAHYVNTNLKNVKLDNEIMINCKSYLAIKESEYEKFIDLYQETYK